MWDTGLQSIRFLHTWEKAFKGLNTTRFQCPGAETHRAGLARQRRRLAQGRHPQRVKPYCHWQIFPATQDFKRSGRSGEFQLVSTNCRGVSRVQFRN
eukprot:4968986-Amphidinium_carterae.1